MSLPARKSLAQSAMKVLAEPTEVHTWDRGFLWRCVGNHGEPRFAQPELHQRHQCSAGEKRLGVVFIWFATMRTRFTWEHRTYGMRFRTRCPCWGVKDALTKTERTFGKRMVACLDWPRTPGSCCHQLSACIADTVATCSLMSVAGSTACAMKKSFFGKMLLCYPMSVDPVLFVCGWNFHGQLFGGFFFMCCLLWAHTGVTWEILAGGACE